MLNLLKNISFSDFTGLRNKTHAHYGQEFVSGILPRGLYETQKGVIADLVGAEIENLAICRKNHYREKWHDKVNYLRVLMSALYCILQKEATIPTPNGIKEKHSYDMKVKGINSNHEYVAGVKAFLTSWAGLSSESADALITEIEDVVGQSDVLVGLMEIEDSSIGNIPPQYTLREKTDLAILTLIRRAQVEAYELNPEVDEERAKYDLVVQFLNGIYNWIRRVGIAKAQSGKNDSEEEEEEKPETEETEENQQTEENQNQEENQEEGAMAE